jgi:Ca-activated chloride channel family protein
MKLLTSLCLATCLATPVVACQTALALTIDVSNSVDPGEYRLQIDGMADALQDPEIVDAMVQGEVAIMVIQWSGTDRQEVSIPWTRIRTALDAERLAAEARLIPRAFVLSDTAPAEAISFALGQFGAVADCEHHVIDVSGDGTPNAGGDVRGARNRAERQGVTINGVAIESMGVAITGFYKTSIITRNGFVITARTHREYPEAIRMKILRELAQVFG